MTYEFEAIGTHWTIDLNDKTPDDHRGVLQEIHAYIAEFDKNYSRFRSDSLVSEMAQRAGTYHMPPDADPMLSLYQNLNTITKGAFTPLVGQLLVDAGYDAEYSLVPKTLHATPAWEDVLDYRTPELTLKKPALLDFGALGKGFLIDVIGEIIEKYGIMKYCVDAGGDIRYRNTENTPLRIGLEHPANPEQVIGVATITNQSLCGSAGNRRAWDQFHHIMNPHTRSSPRHILATWTIASTTLIADAMATCLFFVPPQTLLKYYAFEYIILHPNFSISHSANFPAEIYIQGKQNASDSGVLPDA